MTVAAAPLAPAVIPALPAAPPAAALPVASLVTAAVPAQLDSNSTPAVAAEDVAGVQLQLRSGLVRRSFSFDQDIYQRLRTIDSSVVVYRFDAAFYPTFRWVPFEGRVALIAGYEGALTGSVRDRDFGSNYSISHSELYGGVRVRKPLRQHALGLDVTVGRLHSGLDDGKTDRAGVPEVSYTEVRSALDFTLQLDRFQATAAAGFRVPLGYGELSDSNWFPRVGGYGLEGMLRGSYRLTSRASLEAATSLRRYVLEMNADTEDPAEGRAEVAAGAIDAYWAGYLGVSFSL